MKSESPSIPTRAHTHDPVALDAFISSVVDIGSICFFAGRAWGPADATPRAEYGQKEEDASALLAWSDIATEEPGHATHEVE